MGSDSIPNRSDGDTIFAEWANVIKRVLAVDVLPRNTSGVATDEGGSLGDSTRRWLNLFSKRLKLHNGSFTATYIAPTLSADVTVALPTGTTGPGFVPTGTLLPYGGTSAPDGFLLCDGSAVSRTTYADLFAVIGEAFGQGDNSTTFNLPDSRGRFMRFADGGAGNDPDAASRTAMATGGNTGDAVGSIQLDEFGSHAHSITDPGHAHTVRGDSAANGSTSGVFRNGNSGSNNAGAALSTTTGITTTNATGGSSETRPRNFYVNAIIKT
jgi:microcystin-dependent protein